MKPSDFVLSVFTHWATSNLDVLHKHEGWQEKL